ncbi:MAG: 4-hydroxyphenylacetate 3-hydroxylase N-terminal domain-containing protein [Saprospiraceae bacterium]
MKKIISGEDYINSLRNRKLNIYLLGNKIVDYVDHPMIRPSINALAVTYDLALKEPKLATVISHITGERISRFLHIAQSVDDLVMQNKLQRKLGQLTGTCFQRCVGMDALNALHSVTFEMDENKHTKYHQRFINFLNEMHQHNFVIGGAMTDVKGDRSLAPHAQENTDMYVRITKRTDSGVYITGAKAHQTGCINSHWMIVMPTIRMSEADKDYTIVGAVPVDREGITYIYGRQSCDTRSMEGGSIDVGNATYGGQEAMVIFDNVYIANEHIFMNGEYEYAADLVERFTNYHRRSYVCKSGVGDVLIGAAAEIADMNGVSKASHIKDKLVEMTHHNETIYATGIAASYQGYKMKSGCYMCDPMLANVCKHHVTKLPFEIGRLAQDLGGGLVATMPSEKDLNNPEIGHLVKKYLKGKADVSTEDRMRILRLIENMTLGRNAVGYLTESLHGAGSPQAQRVQIRRMAQMEYKKRLAKVLAGIELDVDKKAIVEEIGGYFERVFMTE